MKKEDYESNDFIVRVRGLPWSAKEGDIKDFFQGIDISNIHFTYTREGRPTGEAYIELDSQQDVQFALLKHKENLKERYIEVFETKRAEMEYVLKRSTKLDEEAAADTVVRLRGLPFGVTSEDVTNFFEGMEVAPDGIIFGTDGSGRLSGEAYVKFLDKETTERALDKHMQNIGHRYIEVFRSTNDELNRARRRRGGGGVGGGGVGGGDDYGKPRSLLDLAAEYDEEEQGGWGGMGYGGGGGNRWNSGPRGRGGFFGGRGGGGRSAFFEDDSYGGGGGGGAGGFAGGMRGGRDRSPVSRSFVGRAAGHVVHMRGLPFKATASDIIEFFHPIKVLNVNVCFCEQTGRPMGEADVEFSTHEDAEQAMSKNKEHMGERYIELFLTSQPTGKKAVPAGPPSLLTMDQNYVETGDPNAAGYGYEGYSENTVTNVDPYANPNQYNMVQYPDVNSYQYGGAY